MTRTPRAFDAAQGMEVLAKYPALAPELSELIKGAAGCSPFLKDLCLMHAEWLCAFFDDPNGEFQKLLTELSAFENLELSTALRQAKGKAALAVALADLGGVWSLHEVTNRLSQFADIAIDLSLRNALFAEQRRGKLPGLDESALEDCAGMVVLAMGKLGAHELNYSSDIDLICLFDETRFEPGEQTEARAALVRATRKMAGMLSDRTAEGYVFRTDLRLRPDPAVTPVCIGVSAAEAYYESLGRTWERAAYIKARPAAGALKVGEAFLKALQPFVWRRHLDFAAIEDAHNMRLRIREHKGYFGLNSLNGHNIKLGHGGIREIEFFTQTRQLISGGRDPSLRVRGTIDGLERLAYKDWIEKDAAQELAAHYAVLREIEHRLQMIQDQQTQTLPTKPLEWDRLAAFCGVDTDALQNDLLERLSSVHVLTEGFFAPEFTPIVAPKVNSLDEDIIARWPNYPALRSDRAVAIFNRLKPEILMRLERSGTPQEALHAFDAFLAGLPAGVQVFSLFEANPQLIDLLVDICGTAPDLASYLSQNAGVLDAVIAGAFFESWPEPKDLFEELQKVLNAESDYEDKLDAARRWHKEWHFRVGVHHLRGLINADTAGAHYAALAEATLAALWPVVGAQFALRHGDAPGRGAVVLGMGSLGAGRLNAASDLDLIVIYDTQDSETSDGIRPLPARTYYARLTQALITALSAPMAEGRLYEVDMRLRPSGNKGPVATSWGGFQSYQKEKAWIWEHLALTRARVVAGPQDLARDVEAFRCDLLHESSDAQRVLDEVAEMRRRISEAKTPQGDWDTKLGAGRMQDIELLAQAGCLQAGRAERDVETGLKLAEQEGWIADTARETLFAAYELCWKVVQVAKLVSHKPLEKDELGEGARAFLLRETGHKTLASLSDDLVDLTARAAAAIDKALTSHQEGPLNEG
ncbi:MAG: glutamine-synthetase adenylyltransferase [Pseudomonadota bacterium]